MADDTRKSTLHDGGATRGVGHLVNDYKKCPRCGGANYEIRDYDEMWRDGEVWCADCNTYIRVYDGG